MTPSIAVRLATTADAMAIATMSRDLIEQGLPWRWTAPRVRACLRDSQMNVAVSMDEGVLLGFGIMLYADEEAHLLLFAVDSRHRRKGIGSALLEWLEVVAREAGIRRIALECRRENDAARNFYGALGYHERRIVRRMYSGVVDGIKLEKWLASPRD
jgi:ribosomal protein S18 acetylase RimI-like enzyme